MGLDSPGLTGPLSSSPLALLTSLALRHSLIYPLEISPLQCDVLSISGEGAKTKQEVLVIRGLVSRPLTSQHFAKYRVERPSAPAEWFRSRRAQFR